MAATLKNYHIANLTALYILAVMQIGIVNNVNGQVNIQASEALLQRVLPKAAKHFIIESLPVVKLNDVFELESRNGHIVLRGTSGVSIASALYFYLNNYCHCQVTWNGTNLHLPEALPVVPHKIHRATPFAYRYYLNYCTFNYSMSWWDWKRWEKEIDWMALHGINMPLAITGEEYTWYKVYRSLGFSEKDLESFFSGPSYFAWLWMGNLDGYGGPLPLQWMKSHALLQKKILQRERELGMSPVLPAFTGHVPAVFRKMFPHAMLKTSNWHNGFKDTYILDFSDPMFGVISKKFLQIQTQMFGTDHLYSADTFNENEPSSNAPEFLASLSWKIFSSMHLQDKRAKWVMQGWLFYSDRKFWKPEQIKALLNAVPDTGMILLDLAAEIEPIWKRTEAFYGKPWIWNMLHNFGGNISLFGRMDIVANEPAIALHDKHSGQMKGIGLTMEGIEQNPVLYELMTAHTWTDSAIDIHQWLPEYIHNRYGLIDDEMNKAWEILRNSVYNGKLIRDGAESIITGRPTFDSSTTWTKTKLNYPPEDILPAWDRMIKAITLCNKSDGFQYDIVDITRQVIANYAQRVHHNLAIAYQQKDLFAFKELNNEFLNLIEDLDNLLGSRKEFLLGTWLRDARAWGGNTEEKNLYERNARNLITLWGDENSPLHEYSCRQWSGLLKDFYLYRWKVFFKEAEKSLENGTTIDLALFDKNIRHWEGIWINEHKQFRIVPLGNPSRIVMLLYKKYRNKVG